MIKNAKSHWYLAAQRKAKAALLGQYPEVVTYFQTSGTDRAIEGYKCNLQHSEKVREPEFDIVIITYTSKKDGTVIACFSKLQTYDAIEVSPSGEEL